MKPLLVFLSALLAHAALAAVDLSPEKWDAAERTRVEALAQLPTPPAPQAIKCKNGIVSATMSPIAVRAGLEALKQGGSAADAAATIALTQITTAFGSYVSYAGLMELTYYDAHSGKVYSMNAGWNSYRGETDPRSIPTGDQMDAAQGRKTMVPGFMAGLEAMHQRFGKLPFATLFSPAIWYAEKGLIVSPVDTTFFSMRQTQLSRTVEGRAFLHQAAADRIPKAGDRFVQGAAAGTLRAVAAQGARYMYTGAWAQKFVDAVQKEGGKVTLEDLAAYAPTWEEPLHTEYAGHTIYAPGRSNEGGYQLLQMLNLLDALGTSAHGPYWQDGQTLLDFSRAGQFAAAGVYVHPAVAATAAATGVTLTPEDRASKAYAKTALSVLDAVFNPTATPGAPKHSDAIVVIDQWGNVAALVHTINTVLWGSTGIVVDGIPLSDAASFQQAQVASQPPGGRVPNEMAPLIAVKDGKPHLAIACIGSSLIPETARLTVGLLAQKEDPLTLLAAPPLLVNFDFTKRATIVIPEKGYDVGVLQSLRDKNITLETKSAQDVRILAGTAVVGIVDENATTLETLEYPSVASFAAGF